MFSDDKLNSNMILLEIIERELGHTTYFKTNSIAFGDTRLTTLYWKKNGLILDILLDENECSLAGKGISYIFSFDIDDAEEVAMEIVQLISNF